MKIDPAKLNRKDAHELLVGAIVPRPIAFVSTVGPDGVYNVAPFSFFAGMSAKPAIVGFGVGAKRDGGKKDTLVNIESTKEFVIAVVTESLAQAMNQASASYPPEVDEFKEAGLTPLKADLVKAPLVGESPINMECRLRQILDFGEPKLTRFVIGEIVLVHVKDEVYKNDQIQISELKAIGRLGADLYCRTADVFEMKRPK